MSGRNRGLRRLHYYRRVLASYLGRSSSQLTFWWERPEVNLVAPTDKVGAYYMTFKDKANYPGPFDEKGVPLLDYHGTIGKQYNPIAIAQYGLAKYNLFIEAGRDEDRESFLRQARWLVDNLRPNLKGVKVWMHDFDWEYWEGLRAPWYSGLAQGQGLSCLVRAYLLTGDEAYMKAADAAFKSLQLDIKDGGVSLFTPEGDTWIEEYLTERPSHILNGFLWGIWGVHDYALATQNKEAEALFNAGSATILRHLDDFDTGWWSLYDLTPHRVRCVTSPFYHQLHIVQLRVMYRLTGVHGYAARADRWEGYMKSGLKRRRAFAHKVLFKVLHY